MLNLATQNKGNSKNSKIEIQHKTPNPTRKGKKNVCYFFRQKKKVCYFMGVLRSEQNNRNQKTEPNRTNPKKRIVTNPKPINRTIIAGKPEPIPNGTEY